MLRSASQSRRICSSVHVSLVILLLLPLACLSQERRSLLYPRLGSVWNVFEAGFGGRVIASSSFHMLLPPPISPEVQNLCEWLPESINSTLIPRTNHNRIGLLVPKSLEQCTPGQQARTALMIQQYIPKVQFLLLYETNADLGSQGETFFLTREEVRQRVDYSSLGVFYLPYTDAQHLLEAMRANLQSNSASSWYLMDPNSTSWQFSVRFGATVRITNSPGVTAFYWLRFFLFTLLIVTPCFRAAFLWYSGGGRLHWRRNEHGRITGILYVPAMPVWLWAARDPTSAPISDVLTEEQFQELPAITFQKAAVKKYHEDVSSQGDDSSGENFKGDVDLENQATHDTTDTSMSDDSAVADGDKDDATVNDIEAGTADSAPAAEEATPAAAPVEVSSDPAHTTTCTMCSICIDDFENGETLILLPICKHAFHKECIHPWLLERQGCCPMCKVNVIHGDMTTDSSDVSIPNNDTSDSEVQM